jgi:hypothetical protein
MHAVLVLLFIATAFNAAMMICTILAAAAGSYPDYASVDKKVLRYSLLFLTTFALFCFCWTIG